MDTTVRINSKVHYTAWCKVEIQNGHDLIKIIVGIFTKKNQFSNLEGSKLFVKNI